MKHSAPDSGVLSSGDKVAPGTYVDVHTGASVHVMETDELPYTTVTLRVPRRFVRVDGEAREMRVAEPAGACACGAR